MLQGGNIAFFIDVDNVGLRTEDYANIIDQLNGMGTILFGKIYGAGERKHKEIFNEADYKGYKMERPMRIKRRGRKEFDARIFVDVVDVITKTPAIDAVCIIAQPTDLVYLYSYLHGRGIKIIALDNADDASCSFIDEVIDLGRVIELDFSKIKQAPAPILEEQVAPVETSASDGLDRTNELLREIERLRELADSPKEQSTNESEEVVPAEEPTSVEEAPTSIVDEANALLDKIAEMQAPEATEEPATVEEESEAVEVSTVEEPEEAAESEQSTPATAAPRVSHAPANDSDLIRRIEEIRSSSDGDDDDFIEEIRKLLDGLE